MKKKCFLLCNVSEGMFPGEKAVEVKSHDRTVSFFLAEDLIFQFKSRSEIKVGVIDFDEQYALVSLPQEPIEGSRVIKVDREGLRDDFIE